MSPRGWVLTWVCGLMYLDLSHHPTCSTHSVFLMSQAAPKGVLTGVFTLFSRAKRM